MGTVTSISRARFAVGDLVHHKLFDYRGVVVDVDASCQASEEWYQEVALSRPPKDQPWYHVLVNEAVHSTYVAERNLEPDDSDLPIHHPMIEQFFTGFEDGRYIRHNRGN